MRAALALCCAACTSALRLELDVDGQRLELHYEASNLWEARFRYAEAFVGKHQLGKYKGLGCEEVIYARHKCVASKIEEAMKAHRDTVRKVAQQWVQRWTASASVAVTTDGSADEAWLQFLAARVFKGAERDAVADPPAEVLARFVALEVGCGRGQLMARLSHKVARLDGVDVSKPALQTAHARLADTKPYTLFHSDGLTLDAVPDDTYHVVYSANLLQRIPIHSIRYTYLEEFFRVTKCDGHVSLQLGFGGGDGADYYDDAFTNTPEVAVTNATHFLADLYRVGFRDEAHEIIQQSPPGSVFAQSLFVVARKQCPLLDITIIIGGVEQPQERGTNRQYVDAVVHDVIASPDGIRRRKKTAENCGAEADIEEGEVDAEIADLERQLEEAKAKRTRKPCKKARKPLHPQFVEDNLVGLDGTCSSCVN